MSPNRNPSAEPIRTFRIQAIHVFSSDCASVKPTPRLRREFRNYHMTCQKPDIAAVRAATALRTIVFELRHVTAAQDQAPTRATATLGISTAI
jgi:hypothetical protein